MPLTTTGFEHDADTAVRYLNLEIEMIVGRFESSSVICIFSFGGDAIEFECRYSRTVSANSDFSVNAPISGPFVGTGYLNYIMDVSSGILGGNTEVTVSPTHSISGISLR